MVNKRQKQRVGESCVVSKVTISLIREDGRDLDRFLKGFENLTVGEIKGLMERTRDHLARLIGDVGAFSEICSHCERK
jgi:hypothetical protein